MSCIIDKRHMNRLRGERGSALMEFILVIPLYILLWGMAMCLGEMGVKTLALAAQDRLDAFVLGSESGLGKSAATYRPDAGFAGAWTWLKAATASEHYTLPTWTRAWLQYPIMMFNAQLGGNVGSGGLQGLIDNGTYLYSKDVSSRVRVYNYYVLRRTADGRNSYRSWDAGNVAKSSGFPFTGSVWYNEVFGEPENYGENRTLGAAALDGERQGSGNSPASAPSVRSDYKRYYQFAMWSQ